MQYTFFVVSNKANLARLEVNLHAFSRNYYVLKGPILIWISYISINLLEKDCI